MGGNFGCWRTTSHPEDDETIVQACLDGYQHDVTLSSCTDCLGLVACLKYPYTTPPTPVSSTPRASTKGATTEADLTTEVDWNTEVTDPVTDEFTSTTTTTTPLSTPPVTPPPGTVGK